MICTRCDTPIRPGARFCARCGLDATHPKAETILASAQGREAILSAVRRDLAAECEIESIIGGGGMSVVFRAAEKKDGKAIAVKTVAFGMAADVGDKFIKEARVAVNLDHPSIVKTLRVGQGDNTRYCVMPFVDGRSLDTLVAAHGQLGILPILAVLRAAASALSYAHDRRVVHRNLTAANILVDKEGRILLADFGLTRAVGESPPKQGGSVFGVPHYLSPEQATGKRVGPAADQYALGVLTVLLLTGKVPFDAESADDIIDQHKDAGAPNIIALRKEAPEELGPIVARVLSKDPSRRYGTMRELVAAIDAMPFDDKDRDQAAATLRSLVGKTKAPALPQTIGPEVAEPVNAPPPRRAAAPPAPAPPPPAPPAAPQPVVTAPQAAAPPPPPPAPPAQSAAPPPPPAAAPAGPTAETLDDIWKMAPEPLVAPVPWATPGMPIIPLEPLLPPEPPPPPPREPRLSAMARELERSALPPEPAMPVSPPPAPPPPPPRVSGARPAYGQGGGGYAPSEPAPPPPPPPPPPPAAPLPPPPRPSGGIRRPLEPRRPPRSRGPLMAAIGVVVGLALAAGGYVVLKGRDTPAPAPTPPPVDSAALAAAADSARRAAADSSLGTIMLVGELDEDAEIYLNGRLVNGLTHRVPPGAYDLEVQVPGFQPFEETIAVTAGRTIRVEPDFVPVPGEGQTPITPLPEGRAALSVRAVPPHAQIVVENDEPVTGELSNEPIASGRPVRLRISAPGYVTFDTLVVAAAGTTLNLGLRTLVPQP